MPLKKTLTLDGLPVVDATEPLVIQIEKADIRRKSPPPGAYKRSTRRDGPPRPYNRSPSQEQHRIQMTHRQVEGLRHCSPLQGGAKEWTQDTPQLAPAIALIEAEPEK